MRDDFSEDTKKQLARRVGYYCSFPNCGTITVGPSSETKSSSSSIGTAAHIAAASSGKGARRYIPTMTSQERKDISNGIWMCSKHGKLIDTDETRFTIPLLKHWKQIAENVAEIMIDNGVDYSTALELMQGNKLVENEIEINTLPTNGTENKIIGDAIFDSCIQILWGKDLADILRDYLIEHVRNAFTHGKATLINLRIADNKVIITDDGSDFNPRNLLQHQSFNGGGISLMHLLSDFGDRIIFATERIVNTNQTIISKIGSASEIYEITPCTIDISFEDFHSGNADLTVRNTCKETYVILPRYFAISDAVRMPGRFPQFRNYSSSLIFVLSRTSSYVSRIISENYPESHVMIINEISD